MARTIETVREHLFDALDRLKASTDPAAEIERARAVRDVAQVIVNSAAVEVKYLEAAGGKGSSAFLGDEQPAVLPPGVLGITQHRLKG